MAAPTGSSLALVDIFSHATAPPTPGTCPPTSRLELGQSLLASLFHRRCGGGENLTNITFVFPLPPLSRPFSCLPPLLSCLLSSLLHYLSPPSPSTHSITVGPSFRCAYPCGHLSGLSLRALRAGIFAREPCPVLFVRELRSGVFVRELCSILFTALAAVLRTTIAPGTSNRAFRTSLVTAPLRRSAPSPSLPASHLAARWTKRRLDRESEVISHHHHHHAS